MVAEELRPVNITLDRTEKEKVDRLKEKWKLTQLNTIRKIIREYKEGAK